MENSLICLITPGHAASAPRLVKEADALVEAGYRVHVVAGRHFPPVDALDREILPMAKWSHTLVDFRRGPAVFARKLARRAARRLVAIPSLASARLAARAHHAETLHFASTAAKMRADLYLGHSLAGLPAAALAARANSCRYGFDAEDFHDAETTGALSGAAESAARRILHRTFLPGCAHFTAAAPLIGRRYATAYGVSAPPTVLNVFPRSHAPRTPIDPGPISASRPARCYWFSQTIGPGRGLESAVAILARMRTPVELHLRGSAAPEYAAQLQALSLRAGLARPIQFLPPGAPSEMARLAASADLGLSVEESTPLNRDLCLTNKIFVYLLAGIPQLLSQTAAQTALAPELADAAILGNIRRPDEVAAALDAFFANPQQVATARSSAWNLAQSKFCWDVEKDKFLASIRQVFVS